MDSAVVRINHYLLILAFGLDKENETMKRLTENTKLTIQITIACLLVIAGLTLLFLGFFAVPIGEISASVLTAFGETGTFAGALMGIDYTYKFKVLKFENEERRKEN